MNPEQTSGARSGAPSGPDLLEVVREAITAAETAGRDAPPQYVLDGLWDQVRAGRIALPRFPDGAARLVDDPLARIWGIPVPEDVSDMIAAAARRDAL